MKLRVFVVVPALAVIAIYLVVRHRQPSSAAATKTGHSELNSASVLSIAKPTGAATY